MAGTTGKKTKKTAKGKATQGRNYVVRSKDGKLLIASGKSGKVTELDKRHFAGIEDLIRERQALGEKLTKLLKEQGYDVAPAFPTIIHVPGDASDE